MNTSVAIPSLPRRPPWHSGKCYVVQVGPHFQVRRTRWFRFSFEVVDTFRSVRLAFEIAEAINAGRRDVDAYNGAAVREPEPGHAVSALLALERETRLQIAKNARATR